MATKIIHLGLGHWGRDWAQFIVPTVPTVETVAWVDSSPEAQSLAQAKLGLDAARCFPSLEAALAEVDADAVVAPVILPAHGPVIEAAAKAGKHVLIEKPFAATVAEAARLTTLAADAGIILHVSQNYRFYPAPMTAYRLINERHLGDVLSVDIEFNKYIPETTYGDVPDILLVDMAIHHWDMLRMLVPGVAQKAAFWTRNPPGSPFVADAAATGMIKFNSEIANGVVATYRGNQLARFAETTWAGNWRIECEDGVISFVSRARGQVRSAKDDRLTVAKAGGAPEEWPLETVEHFGRAGTLNAFALAVQGKPIPDFVATAADNQATIALMEAIVQSSRQDGRPTAVDGAH